MQSSTDPTATLASYNTISINSNCNKIFVAVSSVCCVRSFLYKCVSAKDTYNKQTVFLSNVQASIVHILRISYFCLPTTGADYVAARCARIDL